ncbi:MAG: DUF721 domain-containing protein [Bacteroidota bacterium]
MKKTNEETIKNVLKEWIQSSNLKPKLNQARVVKYWEELMGPTIAGYTRQIYVSKGKLFIVLDSAPLRQELSFGKEKIMSMINAELGEDFVKEVIIR